MAYIALLSEDGSSIIEHRLSRVRLWELFRGVHGLQKASDEALADYGLVRVQETERPVPDPDATITEGPVTLDLDGIWRTTWIVTPIGPDRVAEIKAELLAMAQEVAESKRIPLPTAELMTILQLERAEAVQDGGGTPAPADYPLIGAIAAGRTAGGQPTTFLQAATAVQTFRDQWMTRAVQVETKYREIISRINTATTAAQARAILAELRDMA